MGLRFGVDHTRLPLTRQERTLCDLLEVGESVAGVLAQFTCPAAALTLDSLRQGQNT